MSAENMKLEENKKTVVAFYETALFEGDADTAIRLYGGKTYTQHTGRLLKKAASSSTDLISAGLVPSVIRLVEPPRFWHKSGGQSGWLSVQSYRNRFLRSHSWS
jgi:hypothetical protein